MALVNIEAGEHVTRHCKRKFAIRSNGQVCGVHPDFFYLRTGETYLSAFYFEFFAPQTPNEMNECIAALKAMPFTPNKGDLMVKLEAEAVRQAAIEFSVKLRVVHDNGNKKTPSKAQVLGIPTEPNVGLGGQLASSAVVDWKVF